MKGKFQKLNRQLKEHTEKHWSKSEEQLQQIEAQAWYMADALKVSKS